MFNNVQLKVVSWIVLVAPVLILSLITTGYSAEAEHMAQESSEVTSSVTGSQPSESPVEQRLEQEKQVKQTRFSILPHRPNYLLPFTYSFSPNRDAYANLINGEEYEKVEMKFQLSIKIPLWENMILNNGTLYLAYSQLAFWQAYNSRSSAPFREINYEPELFVAFETGFSFLGIKSQLITLGYNHHSNGQSQPLSRSWNRIVMNFILNKGNTSVVVRPWYRIPEGRDDDNPDILTYYGYGELLIVQKIKEHTVSLMLRNNFRTSGNKGAMQLDWSFPLHPKLKG
ncbi:MAG: phospholipase A, partial [Nitrospirota bacterium]